MRTSLTVCAIALSSQLLCAEGALGQSLKENNITYVAKNVPVRDAFEQLSKLTGFYFFYDESVLSELKDISIKVKDGSIDAILNQLSSQTGLYFKKINNTISISKQHLQSSEPEVTQQKRMLTGTILDNNGEPIVGANVSLKGTTTGTITDMDGRFSLEASENQILLVSYIGYVQQELQIGNKMSVKVTLREDSQALDEVVVVGYATQKKANLTGAVSSVSAKQLENRPMTNIGQGIQGLVPNVNITMPASGNPGTGAEYNIRGVTSLSGGGPLVLVDGVQMDPNIINPQDVESMSFLKDAASSSIYGARAAYGVILITTKKGKDGKPQISYSNNLAFNSPIFKPEMQNSVDWAETVNRGFTNLGNNPFVSEVWMQHIKEYAANPETAPNWYPDPNGYANAGGGSFNYCGNVNYPDAVYKKSAFMQQHTASMQGGSEKFKYYTSLGYNQQNGFLKYADDTYNRFNAKVNLSSQITKWLKVGVNSSYNASTKENPAGCYWGSNPDGGRVDFSSSGSFWGGTWPVIPLTISGYPGLDAPIPSYTGSWTNPIQLQRESGKENRDISDLWFGGNIDISPVKGLNIHVDYTYNHNSNTNKAHVKKMMNQDPITGNWGTFVHTKDNWVTMENGQSQYTTINAIADYSLTLKKNSIKVMAGMNKEDKQYRWFWARHMGLINNDFPAMNQATGAEKTNYKENEWGVLGFFGRINYNFDEKYFLEVNGRYDGSSRFPTGNKFAFFPSLSGGWMVSNEAFFSNVKNIVSTLKVRGSWGELGNIPSSDDIGLYPYVPSLGTVSQISYIMNSSRPVGITPAALTTDMTWETVKQWNIGVDFGFLNDKLSGSFDYYNRGTYGMIGAGTPLPAILGTNVPLQNASDLMTRGFELALNWRSNIGEDFYYNAGIVFSDNSSEITYFDNPTGILSSNYIGKTIGEIWGYHSDGVFQSDAEAEAYQQKYDLTQVTGRKLKAGDVRYLDINGDGKVTPGLTTDDTGDQSIIGNTEPRYAYGVNLGCNWKGLDFRMFMQGIGKRHIDLSWTSNIGDEWAETYSFMSDTWTPENPNASFPRVTVGDGSGANTRTRTTGLGNAAYLRLKELSLGYSLPKTWINQFALQNVRINLSGYNLLTFTGLHEGYYDPETRNMNAYPIFKSLSFGIDITL